MIDDHPSGTTDEPDESAFETHDDWKSGDPCPECGHEFMYVVQVSNETYQHAEGTYEHIDYGAYREDLKVTCKDCHTVLLRHPAMNQINSC